MNATPLFAGAKYPHVRMRDAVEVERKMRVLCEDGFDRLMVISDFDFTITKYHDANGARCWSTHGVFDRLSERHFPLVHKELKAANEKYVKIEYDPHLSMQEKVPHMEDWWRNSHELIVQAGFDRTTVEAFVDESKVELRDGAEQIFPLLSTHRVPLILFSAGIGNIIELFLQRKLGSERLPNNVHLISNMMTYDEQDRVCAFSQPLIHTFCKNATVITGERSFFHEISTRTNVLLLGDGLGDIHMDVGVEREGVALKIGFLNFDIDILMEKFLDGYDIVVIDDQSMEIPMSVLRTIEHRGTLVIPPVVEDPVSIDRDDPASSCDGVQQAVASIEN